MLLSLLVALTLQTQASPQPEVHHPAPKEPIFLKASAYAAIKKTLQLPPKAGSAAQQKDEATLREFQKSRTPQQCEAAQSEVMVTLQNFYGQPHGPFSNERIAQLAPFFEQVRNDADFFIQKLKKDFPRPRPFLYLKDLEPCVPREVTGAYPSGHAVLSKLFALILADLQPAARAQLETRAQEIAEHRVLSGMHHPTDIEAGRALADWIYQELQRSKEYQAAFQAQK
jgi:acid phosphatase (class A)